MPDPIAVNTMFCRIARRYDLANRLLSGGVDRWWRRCLVAGVRRTGAKEVLDVATGSGDVAFSLSDHTSATRIIGVDFCAPMLEAAEQKKAVAGGESRFAKVSFRPGDGLALPFEANSFNAVTISFGLRNMADRRRCLEEMRRVLAPGGRLFILEFSQPSRWFKPLYLFYLRKILPSLAGALTGDRAAYVYLNETIEQFPDADALSREILNVGFTDVRSRKLSFGIVALHECAK
ncbi:MAG: bifunctional demethylmenaquinone methyltransferase/2-methoxy-6-polyprenyl-1,4-benzoquinol methylase UbiE [Opitutaceae bacterium]